MRSSLQRSSAHRLPLISSFMGPNMTHDLFTFTGRKPSFKQCLAQAKRMSEAGRLWIELQWGENWLQLEKSQNYWQGYGHIRDIDAGIIARELNHL